MDTALQSYRYLKIHDLPTADRPRERLISQGAPTLTNAELLAILIGSGVPNMTSVDLAKHLLKNEDDCLSNLAKRSVQELVQYRGIGYAKAAIIASAMELSQRKNQDSVEKKPVIEDTKTAYQYLRPHFEHKLTEECWVMLVNRRKKWIKNHQISKGGLAKTNVDPRVIFKVALDYHAHGIILAHNHPSGDPNPSGSDISVTTSLLKASQYLDITLLDHLIVTDHGYFSFADNSLI